MTGVSSYRYCVRFHRSPLFCIWLGDAGEPRVATVNSQYNVARSDSLPIKITGHQRRKMFKVFLSASGLAPDDTVVDIGVTSDRSYHHSNYFEAWYPHKSRITAVGLDDASFLEQQYTLEANS